MNKYILTGISLIIILTILIGCTGKPNTLNGTIFVSGNEPFTYLAFKGEDDNYYKLECDEPTKKELWSMQGQKVKLEYSDLMKLERESVITVIKFNKMDSK